VVKAKFFFKVTVVFGIFLEYIYSIYYTVLLKIPALNTRFVINRAGFKDVRAPRLKVELTAK